MFASMPSREELINRIQSCTPEDPNYNTTISELQKQLQFLDGAAQQTSENNLQNISSSNSSPLISSSSYSSSSPSSSSSRSNVGTPPTTVHQSPIEKVSNGVPNNQPSNLIMENIQHTQNPPVTMTSSNTNLQAFSNPPATRTFTLANPSLSTPNLSLPPPNTSSEASAIPNNTSKLFQQPQLQQQGHINNAQLPRVQSLNYLPPPLPVPSNDTRSNPLEIPSQYPNNVNNQLQNQNKPQPSPGSSKNQSIFSSSFLSNSLPNPFQLNVDKKPDTQQQVKLERKSTSSIPSKVSTPKTIDYIELSDSDDDNEIISSTVTPSSQPLKSGSSRPPSRSKSLFDMPLFKPFGDINSNSNDPSVAPSPRTNSCTKSLSNLNIGTGLKRPAPESDFIDLTDDSPIPKKSKENEVSSNPGPPPSLPPPPEKPASVRDFNLDHYSSYFRSKILPDVPNHQKSFAEITENLLKSEITSIRNELSICEREAVRIYNTMSQIKQTSEAEISRYNSLVTSSRQYIFRIKHLKTDLETFTKEFINFSLKRKPLYNAFLRDAQLLITTKRGDRDIANRQFMERLSFASKPMLSRSFPSPFTDLNQAKNTIINNMANMATMSSMKPSKSLFGVKDEVASFVKVKPIDEKDIQNLLDNVQFDGGDSNPNDRKGTPEGMTITLLEHQKIGLSWLLNKEAKFCGGILADDMGLGKTIQMIALILSRPSSNPEIKTTLIITPVALIRQWERELKTRLDKDHQQKVLIYHGLERKNGTFEKMKQYDIVITTYGVIGNEYKEHFPRRSKKNNPNGTRSKYKRKGSAAASSTPFSEESISGPAPLQSSVMDEEDDDELEEEVENDGEHVTVPGTGRSPFFKDGSVFYRIILDEAQMIKNRKTRTAISCCRLEASFRWCLSGTPMQNNVSELQSLIKFLRIEPYCDEKKFNTDIGNILDNKSKSKFRSAPNMQGALKKLRVLLKAIMLRRTKSSKIDGKPLLQLTPREIEINNLTFSPDEQEYYNYLETGAIQTMNKYLVSGSITKNYSNILVMLLRLRQCCCHPKIIEKANLAKELAAISARSGKAAVAAVRNLNNRVVMSIRTMSDYCTCPCCEENFDKSELVFFSPCGHAICSSCCTSQYQQSADDADNRTRCVVCNHVFDQKGFFDYIVFKWVHILKLNDSQIASQRFLANRTTRANRLNAINEMIAKEGARKPIIDDDDDDLFGEKDTTPQSSKTDTTSTDLKNVKTEEKVNLPVPDEVDDTQIDSDDSVQEIKPEDIGLPASSTATDSSTQVDSKNPFIIDEEEDDLFGTKPSLNGSTTVKNESSSGNNLVKNEEQSGSTTVKEEIGVKDETLVKGEDSPDGISVPTLDSKNVYSSTTTEESGKDITFGARVTRPDLMPIFPNGWISSTKVDQCMRLIEKIRADYPGEKILVFSQFRTMLDFIEVAFEVRNSEVEYCRYDGSMNATRRHETVVSFTDNPRISVLLISLKAGNVGLTLTAASHVILIDPFWNPFVEEQAMDRAHRIGQTRTVHIHRLYIQSSVEDRILRLQEKKRLLIGAALDEKELKTLSSLNQTELLYLFGMDSRGHRSANLEVPDS